jgi:hypothetical protein
MSYHLNHQSTEEEAVAQFTRYHPEAGEAQTQQALQDASAAIERAGGFQAAFEQEILPVPVAITGKEEEVFTGTGFADILVTDKNGRDVQLRLRVQQGWTAEDVLNNVGGVEEALGFDTLPMSADDVVSVEVMTVIYQE